MTSSPRTGWLVALLVVALLAAFGGAGWAALVLVAGAAVGLLGGGRDAPASRPRHARRPGAPARRPVEEPMWGVWPAAAAGPVILTGDRVGADGDEGPGEDGADDCDAAEDVGPVDAWHEPAPEVVDPEEAEADGGGWGESGWHGGGGWGESGWKGGGGWGSLPADAHDLDEVDGFDYGLTDGDW